MDQVFRKITIRPPTLLARQNDRMAVHVCSWQILLQKSVETGGEA
jgi:hypothetical protein